MLITKSRMSFTSTGPDRLSILHDKNIPELAKKNNWPFVALADERTMAGALEFLAAARKTEINAAAGIQISNLKLADGNTTTLICIAMSQNGLQRLMAASGVLQSAENLEEVTDELAKTAPERPDIICVIVMPTGMQPSPEIAKIPDTLKKAGLGPVIGQIEPGGVQESMAWADPRSNYEFSVMAKIATLRIQTAYAAREMSAKAKQALASLSASRATAQAKVNVPPPETPQNHIIPRYTDEDFEDKISSALIGRITPMRLDHKPALPERLGLQDGEDPFKILTDLARSGLARMKANGAIAYPERASERLETELKIIHDKGFANYFLIIRDAIAYARENGIPVGPGRGSVAGSLVAYTTGITLIDPLRHGLLFERFINPEREALPDIDTDFCAARRIEVFRYLREKYGAKRVAHISTYADAKPRSTIRDTARILGLQGAASGLINTFEEKLPKSDAAPTSEEIVAVLNEIAKDPSTPEQQCEIAKLTIFSLGMPSTASIHAGGIVLSDDPTTSYCPVHSKPDKDGLPIGQFTMETIEKTGLTKFDFLSLKTLTVINDAINLIEKRTGHRIDPNRDIPEHDPDVFKLISSGKTQTIFQMENHRGIGSAAKEIGITSMPDIISLVALYRPGPMDNIPTYAARKNGQAETTYPHHLLEGILAETYGIIIYQEQIMQIAQIFAGYSPGQADTLRKAVGKKKLELIMQERKTFSERAVLAGQSKEDAETIFDFIIPFARYGFNKSHAAAYASLTWQTAWLRYHFPAEWFASCASHAKKKSKTCDILRLARNSGVIIDLPDINKEANTWETHEDENGKMHICCPLSLIEKTKTPDLEAIDEARQKTSQGKFGSMTHLLSLVGTRHNSTLISCINAGAADHLSQEPPQVARAIFRALIADPHTLRPNEKEDDRQGSLIQFDAPTEKSKDPSLAIIRKIPSLRENYAPMSPVDAEEEQNALLNDLTVINRKGASTKTSDWLRTIENLMTIDAARKIATQSPAHALAVLTSIHDQKEAMATGHRIIEANIEDETGQYTFDIAKNTAIDPQLVSRSRRTIVKITLSPATNDALLSGRPVITSISLCQNPITAEKKTFPLLHANSPDTATIMAKIRDITFAESRKFLAQKRKDRSFKAPDNPRYALLVTTGQEIIPISLLDGIRAVGVDNAFGGIEEISHIET